jgi:protease-4
MIMRDERGQRGRGCSVVFFVILFAAVAAGLYFWLGRARVPGKTVLEADFTQGAIEYLPDDPVARVMLSRKQVLRDVVEALQRASEDDRVVGLIARVGEPSFKIAQVQEVRDAIALFRGKGKYAVAYAETFGEAAAGNRSYYLATAFDEINMQPSGDVGLTGLIYESRFLKGTLDKLGIIPRVDHRKEYKSFKYLFTERKYTAPHREAVVAVMESQFGQMVKGIAETRKLSEEQVRALIDSGPFIGNEAVDAKLVDRLAYRDEAYAGMEEKLGKKVRYLSLLEYLKRAGGPHRKGETIALIYGAGGIQRGKSGYNPATGEIVMGSDTVSAAFRKAAEDEDVKAILFRVDSTGGSYVASDTIRWEVANARKKGKPVVVSMGAVAGSGGYFVAMAADKIVAQPATITGSIGVVGGKMVTTGFWNKLGVTWDEVHTSKNADAWTMQKDLSPRQWARMQEWLDRVYDDFTTKVSEDRKLPKDKVLSLAKGRIWTGEDAKALGLVDELGGFATALRLARQAAKIPDDEPVRFKVYPERKSLLKQLLAGEWAGRGEAVLQAAADVTGSLQPLFRAAESVGLTAQPDVLGMQEFGE